MSKGGHRRLLGERVQVRVAGCPPRDGVLLAGVKKESKYVQKFPIRFPNGDVRTYRGDQLLLRGTRAPLHEYIRVGDIIYTKLTLGVIRFIGPHEDFPGPVMVMESIDPKLDSDPDIASFRKTFPSANLSDSRSYNILTKPEEILKVLPPDAILQQLSRIKDKYLAFVADTREKDKNRVEETKRQVTQLVDAEVERRLKEREEQQEEEKELEEENTEDPRSPSKSDKKTKTITFGPGRLGIKAVWATGKVEGVSEGEQAQRLGVQVGWMIDLIDGEPYSEELIDSKTAGNSDYILTFDISEAETGSGEVEASAAPAAPVTEKPLHSMLVSETDKENYERRISELNEQIEDFQYTVESLQKKNSELEEEHKEMTKLRVKVEHLRNSRVMFMSQIREMQKSVRDWKAKAEEWETKYKQLEPLAKGQQGDDGNGDQPPPRSPKKTRQTTRRRPSKSNSDEFVMVGPNGKPRPKVKKKSGMPMPDPASTLSLTNYQAVTTPKAGDGSSQFVSLSSVKKKDQTANGPATPEGPPPNTKSSKGKEKKAKKKRGMSWFKGGKEESAKS